MVNGFPRTKRVQALTQVLNGIVVLVCTVLNISHIMRKPVFFFICEKKGADQLHGNRAADQRLCFATS